MADFMNRSLLRMRSLMQPQTAPMSPMPMQSPVDQGIDPETMISQRMRSIYQPQSDASNRLDTLLGQYPQHENPSIMRKIGAALTGVGYGIDKGKEFLDEPFNEKLTDWKNQVGPAYQAAQIERGENTNERTFAYQTAANDIRNELAQAKITNDQGRLAVAQDRAKVYQMKAEDPNVKYNFSGPTVLKTDKDGNVTDTGVKTGSLTDADKINLQTKGAIQVAQVRGSEARKTEEVKQDNREATSELKGAPFLMPDPTDPTKQIAVMVGPDGTAKPIRLTGHKENVGALTKPNSGGTGKGELPTQTKVREYNAARQAYNQHPEWQKWIKLDSPAANDFTLKPPTTGGIFSSGPELNDYKMMFQTIYGRPMTEQDMTTPPQNIPSISSNTQGQRIRVRSKKTGRTGTWPADQPLTADYERIQ